MKRSAGFAIVCSAFALTAAPAAAATFVYGGALSGAAEVPANASPGTGSARVYYDDVAHTLHIKATFSGLLGPTTASHIHIGTGPGTNGSVATQTPSFVGFPLGVTAGTYDQTLDLTQASSFNASFVTANGGTAAGAEAAFAAALAGGRAYFNVHTSVVPAGEIRADLGAVPEPTSWLMMIGGFAIGGQSLRRGRLGSSGLKGRAATG